MRVGFIGLGSQGGPMARRIIEGGFPTTLWARRSASVTPFEDTPATIAHSPAELAAASDLICLCVVGAVDIEEVADGEQGLLAGVMPGSVIALHSTVHPDTCKALAKRAGGKGVSVIDAPVSGGGSAAAERRLMVMVGGDADTVESCRPVFETFGDPVVHLGDLGAGQTAKLLNNLLFTAHLGIAAATLSLTQSLGIAAERLVEVVARSSGNSSALNALADSGGLDRLAGLAGPLLQKDVRLIADLATAAGAEAGAVLAAADAALALMDHPR